MYTTIDSYIRYAQIAESESTPVMDLDTTNEVQLVKIQILTGTATINCGVSSNDLKHVKYKVLPPTLHDVVQGMGRVDRLLTALFGSNTYEIHLLLYSSTSLYIRIMRGSDPRERGVQETDMQEMLI